MPKNLSRTAFDEASKYIPGGVNSPVRALKSVGADPLFVRSARGAGWTDVDGKSYIDYCLSWGVFILGHRHPEVSKAAVSAIRNGSSYGIPSLPETTLARMIVESIPSVEQVRFVSSGTEAVMSAVRLARGYTGKKLIVKFDGCYHGHADHLLVAAGSGVAGLGTSSSTGVPAEFTALTVSLPFNDMDAVTDVFEKCGDDIAAVILEPVPANMGVVLPKDGFLEFLRNITLKYGSLLIFDEVITGFRPGLGGAQVKLGVTPDLTTLGKIIGGGFPAAAFGGKKEIMQYLAPVGSVYQAGTLSGNPVAMHAGIATLNLLKRDDFYSGLSEKSAFFKSELSEIIRGKDIVLNHFESMFSLFFSSQPVNHFEDVKRSDIKRFNAFWKKLAGHGIYFSPSAFETSFISDAHSYPALEKTLKVIRKNI